MSKQDKVYARTASDLERKYNFGKTFGEVYGLISDARKSADEAMKAVDGLDKKLSHEEIFNRFTNYGKVQGIYRSENDDIYINASYIKSGLLSADRIDANNLKVKAANIDGTLSAEQIVLTGSITWQDLSSGVQGAINSAGGISEYEATTIITNELVSSPTIMGASIYGGSFMDLNGKTRLYLNPSASSSGNADLILHNGSNVAFRIYDEITGTIQIYSYGEHILSTGIWGTVPHGDWNFSYATVTGLNVVFG